MSLLKAKHDHADNNLQDNFRCLEDRLAMYREEPMNTFRDRINAFLDKHGVYMQGKKAQLLYRKVFLFGLFLGNGTATLDELLHAIPKDLPHNTEIEYCAYHNEIFDGIHLKFTAEERVTGDEEAKLRRGINRIRNKYQKGFCTPE
jgi:hypothetical protein